MQIKERRVTLPRREAVNLIGSNLRTELSLEQ